MTSSRPARVLLVGFQDQDNLGLRYLASSLRAAGHEFLIENFSTGAQPIISAARRWNPDIVGFSLIFQFMAQDFAHVIKELREAGIQAHLTMGGHFASFAQPLLFELIPELDSIVNFEGEKTLVELAEAIANNGRWQDTHGIAWKDGSGVNFSARRENNEHLDTLPWPERSDINYSNDNSRPASMLASRGCPWNCSFCSIVTFYEGNGTRNRRRRKPSLVADEMEYLVRERGVRTILFQDDDFLGGGKGARDWALELSREITQRGLQDQMHFKISCRSDEVREEIIAPLIDAGLAYVYLGVESGDPDELVILNKHITADVHIRAGSLLRRLNLSFDFGFMLMTPWATMGSIRNNLAFLRKFCGDGYSVTGYCRTLPYAGTPIEQRLKQENRLRGSAWVADYQFLDRRIDAFWEFSLVAFHERNYSKHPTIEILRALLFESRLSSDPSRPHHADFLGAVCELVAASNAQLINIAEEGLNLLESGIASEATHPALLDLARFARTEDQRIRQAADAMWEIRPRAVAVSQVC